MRLRAGTGQRRIFPFPMKLHTPSTDGRHTITAYDADHVAVDGQRLTQSFLLTPQRLVENWPPPTLDALTAADIEAIAAFNCPIVLLGTGQRQRFPSPALLRPLFELRIGVEVMDTFAACRTYNILMAEGRDVLAALILDGN